MKHLDWLAVLVAPLLSLSGCASQSSGGCAQDADCSTGLFCEKGACLCRTDDACGADKYCNPWGACQARPPCLGNQDCPSGQICNSADATTGGSCIPATSCGSALHCAFNNYCSKPSADTPGACLPGCRETADCQLGDVCSGGQCLAGGTASDCTVCPASPDPDPSYCDYGEICTFQGDCRAAPGASEICATCSQSQDCTGSDTICLVDEEVQNAQYCAPKCKYDTDCPNGYNEDGCGKLIIVDPAQECTGTGSCSGGRICRQQAESANAYCSCLSNDDCGDTSGAVCSLYNGKLSCENTGLPCANDDDCAVSCVLMPYGDTTAGVCLTAVGACGKNQGFTCQTLKTTPADCRLY